ncbi:preprotein translocase subunit YajC [Methylolobus aquaticus]|uniref:preprotein translocase subunit YajC n=1 Tax=Methylotetracoccus oryzae TaxID=1919059 RepID=UPI0010211B28|nr:preprotein translocase subunit YajC [Methylotetracoccus oryzae]RYU60470.1 preprotein translocase subunit YajC [Methylolobus aquaticus]
MDFLISSAHAQAAGPAAQEPGFAGLILPIAILLMFFLLFVLPQHRRGREQKKMIESLAKGVEVVTNGGLLGKIVDLDENFIVLEVGDNVQVNVQRHAVASLMPKGTYKASKRKQEKLDKPAS